MKSIVGSLFSLSLILATQSAFAQDDVQAEFDNVVAQYNSDRGNLSVNDQIIASLTGLFARATDADLKYQIAILKTRALYFKGASATSKDAKISIHDMAMSSANAAIAVNADYSEAYYLYAINLGRWALAKGKLTVLGRKGEMFQALKNSVSRLTYDGENGETYDYYGPMRTYAKFYHELPGIAGGDEKLAFSYISKAYKNAPNNALNVAYYAQILHAQGREYRSQACDVIENLLKQDPKTFNPERVPETIREFEEAVEIKSDMRC